MQAIERGIALSYGLPPVEFSAEWIEMSTLAVRLFLRRVVIDQAFPLELKVPNAETLAAMEDSRGMMANDAPLGPEWPDCPLKGDWSGHRTCHIGGDFLLIDQVLENRIHFVWAGTHAELFSS